MKATNKGFALLTTRVVCSQLWNNVLLIFLQLMSRMNFDRTVGIQK